MQSAKLIFYGDNREQWKPHIDAKRKEIEDRGYHILDIVVTTPDFTRGELYVEDRDIHHVTFYYE